MLLESGQNYGDPTTTAISSSAFAAAAHRRPTPTTSRHNPDPQPDRMLSPLRRDLHPTRPVSRRAWALAAVLATLAPLLTLGAQARTYTLLGDARSVQPTPGGVLLRAEHGSVLIESVRGVGVRVRVRFGDSVSTRFPTPHSLATGDALSLIHI